MEIIKYAIIGIFIMIISSCNTFEKKVKRISVKKNIEETISAANTAMSKLGKTFNQNNDVQINYEIEDKNNTIINISSRSELAISISKNALLQQIYLSNGGEIPSQSKYLKKNEWLMGGLTLLNAGLGLGYAYSDNIVMKDDFLKWFTIIGYGVFDGAYTTSFVYGLVKNNSFYTYLGALGMVLFKGVPLLSANTIRMHNEIISSGYNFDKEDIIFFPFMVKEF